MRLFKAGGQFINVFLFFWLRHCACLSALYPGGAGNGTLPEASFCVFIYC